MKKIIYLLMMSFVPIGLYGQITQQQKIVTSDREAGNSFGIECSMSGNYAVFGVPTESEDASGGSSLFYAGAAYVYERDVSTGIWAQTQKVVHSDRDFFNLFGISVAISGDFFVVGASFESEDASGGASLGSAGAAYVYGRNGAGTWTEKQKIVSGDRDSDDALGQVVAMSGDQLALGAPGEDEDASGGASLSSAGSVYIYKIDEFDDWQEKQKIVSSDRAAGDSFGGHISMWGDQLVVGADFEDEDAIGGATLNEAGSAYVFKEDDTGTWTEKQKIVSGDRAADDKFGSSVAISRNVIVIGAPFEDEDAIGGATLSNAGSAYVFEKSLSGEWIQVKKLVSSDRGLEDRFGNSVAVSGDQIIVSAINEDEDASGGSTLNDAGSAYIFEKDEAGIWTEVKKVVTNDRAADDKFGSSVAVSEGIFLVGANGEDEDVSGGNTLSDAGSAYFFEPTYDIIYTSGSWTGGSGASGEPTSADGSKQVHIKDGSASLSSAASVERVKIEDGASLTLTPSASLEISQYSFLATAEGLVLESDATGMATLLDGGVTYEHGGSVKVERYIPFTSTVFLMEGYHYIGSPIENHAKFSDMTDLYGYKENSLEWVHHNDITDGFSNYKPAAGYAIRYTSNITKDFIGCINSGDMGIAVTSTNHGGDIFEHYNLMANPYPSSISANSLVSENSSILGTTLYFWNGQDYATYNTSLSAGTAGAIGVAPDGNISLGQAFFAEATSAGDVTFTDAMRGADSDIFYKKESFPQLRLLVTSGAEKSDLLLTGHQASSKNVDEYDAKQLTVNTSLSLGSLLNDKVYDIESVPNLSENKFDLVVNSSEAKELTFMLSDLRELEGKRVYLEDREKGTFTDITNASYTTRISFGEDRNRFKLRVTNDQKALSAWINNGQVQVFVNDEVPVDARLISLDGKTLAITNDMLFDNWNSLASGVYLLELTTSKRKYIQKVIK